MQTCDLLIKDGTLLIKYDQLEEHVDMAVPVEGFWRPVRSCGKNIRPLRQ